MENKYKPWIGIKIGDNAEKTWNLGNIPWITTPVLLK